MQTKASDARREPEKSDESTDVGFARKGQGCESFRVLWCEQLGGAVRMRAEPETECRTAPVTVHLSRAVA